MAWTKSDIIAYYKRTQFGYSLWGKNMHYGYWDESTKTLRQATQRFVDVLTQTASINNTDHVLDMGCGVGGSSISLAKKTGCKVTGITICAHQVAKAYKNAQKAGVSHLTEFHEMDYQKTTFPDKTFTVAWGLESICYAESKERLIKEAFRVLKDNGRLVIADGFASRQSYEGYDKFLMQRWLDGWVVNFLNTPADFKKFAESAGYGTSTYRNVTPEVFRTSVLMYWASLLFFPFHLINAVFPMKEYPADAMYHQYLAMKKKLWEYGIFYATKK